MRIKRHSLDFDLSNCKEWASSLLICVPDSQSGSGSAFDVVSRLSLGLVRG